MADESRFDGLFESFSRRFFPEFYPPRVPDRLLHLLFKAQAWAESGFRPGAVSPCGAKGLMQIMPATATELIQDPRFKVLKGNLFDPETNICLGIGYDRMQYERFPEIPEAEERLKFMLAAYNCGRGYVNAALRLARQHEFGFVPLACVPGKWQTWKFASPRLADPECAVLGKKPDFMQVWQYVEKVWKKYEEYRRASRGAR